MSWCDSSIAKVRQKDTRKTPVFLAHCRAVEKKREETERVAIESYWNSLKPDEQSALETRALEMADPTVLNSPLRQSYLKSVRNAYIRTLLFEPSLS